MSAYKIEIDIHVIPMWWKSEVQRMNDFCCHATITTFPLGFDAQSDTMMETDHCATCNSNLYYWLIRSHNNSSCEKSFIMYADRYTLIVFFEIPYARVTKFWYQSIHLLWDITNIIYICNKCMSLQKILATREIT